MATLKAEKTAGSQLFGQVKKEPAPKAGDQAASKGSKQAPPKKNEQKPAREPKKKGKGAKPANKN